MVLTEWLEFGLKLSAAGMGTLALVNFSMERILNWEADVAKMPLLIREVFRVHAWFISITLFIFAAMSWRFAAEIAAGEAPVYRWLAAGIGGFWAIRITLQLTYYSAAHWRGNPGRFAVHLFLLAVYGGWAGLYLLAAFQHYLP